MSKKNQIEENFKKKNLILDQLRNIIKNNFDVDIKVVRELQQSWQDIGPVPGNQNKFQTIIMHCSIVFMILEVFILN